MEDQNLIDTLISNKLITKTFLLGFAILAIYFIINYLTSSDVPVRTATSNSDNFNTTLNSQIQMSNKNKGRKRLCIIWKQGMQLEDLKSLFSKAISFNYEVYLIIRTDSNDIPSSKAMVKEFSILVSEQLIKDHVRLIIIKIINSIYCVLIKKKG